MDSWVVEEMRFDFTRYTEVYTADFETSTPLWFDKEYQKKTYGIEHDEPERARIWAWDVCKEVGKQYVHKSGTNMLSFMLFLKRLQPNCLIAFHNLAFDGSYIISWLLEQGFTHVSDTRPRAYEFSTCISDMGQHYCYEINLGDGHVVTIMDSLKYIMASVKEIAKMYNLPILKGECDYNKYRFPDEPISDSDLSYIHNDTEIMRRAISINLSHGQRKFTQAGNARFEFKHTFPNGSYDVYFPELPNDVDAELRKAYVGGFCYVNPKYRCKDLGEMISMDYNSMYPSQMLFKPMPYGEPWFGRGKYRKEELPTEQLDLYIQNVTAMFELKEDGIPMIPKRKMVLRQPDTYLTSSEGKMITMTLSSPDLELFFMNYDVLRIEYNWFYAFKSCKGRFITPEEAKHMTKDEIISESGKGSLYYKYFLKWRYIKEYSQGTERAIAKRMQNALYGAEACNPLRSSSIPYLDENGLLKYTIHEAKDGTPMYLPASIFTTAWSRYEIITAIHKYRDRFVYCDTDSLYMLGHNIPKDINIHDSLYGFFKIEHIIEKARFIGAKRYIYYARTPKSRDYKWEIACCGAGDSIKSQMCWRNFLPNRTFYGKLSMKTIAGGKHLVETTYRLTV